MVIITLITMRLKLKRILITTIMNIQQSAQNGKIHDLCSRVRQWSK